MEEGADVHVTQDNLAALLRELTGGRVAGQHSQRREEVYPKFWTPTGDHKALIFLVGGGGPEYMSKVKLDRRRSPNNLSFEIKKNGA